MTGVRRGFALRLVAAGAAGAFAWWLLRPAAYPPPDAPSGAGGRAAPAEAPAAPEAGALRAEGPPSSPSSGAEPVPPASPGPPPEALGRGPRAERPADPDLATIRGFLAQALEEHFSRHKLTGEELDRLAGSVLALREARRQLAALERRPENAEELARAREEVARAAAHFEEILDMSPAEFTEVLARAEGLGLSDPDDREPVPPGAFLEDLPPRELR